MNIANTSVDIWISVELTQDQHFRKCPQLKN